MKKHVFLEKGKTATAALIAMIMVAVVCCGCAGNGDEEKEADAAIGGYVKSVDADGNRILICCAREDALDEESWGDYSISLKEDAVISDGRSLASIEQGEYIIVTYTGGIAETYPAQIDGAVQIQFTAETANPTETP